MKLYFFPVLENGENGLNDEGVDEAMPPPRIFGLEMPLHKFTRDLTKSLTSQFFCNVHVCNQVNITHRKYITNND